MKIENLKDAKESIKIICEGRKTVLIKLLETLDEYANHSLAPDEHNDYEKLKRVLIERNSQHENI